MEETMSMYAEQGTILFLYLKKRKKRKVKEEEEDELKEG
jgi:hypothetical protein